MKKLNLDSDANATIQQILSGAQAVLGDNLAGMYLEGSLALGDFDPHRSDIDFVVVTTGELSTESIAALTSLHVRIAAGESKWATELEGSYIPQHALRRYNPACAHHPHIYHGTGPDESRLIVMQHDSDWVVHRHILREHGVVLTGPHPHTLIDPITPGDLRQAVFKFAHNWGSSLLREPQYLQQDGYHAYIVVTLCRMLYTFEHGAIVSKPVAARWAQAAHGRWSPLIQRALASDIHRADMAAMLSFVRYTVEKGQPFAAPTSC